MNSKKLTILHTGIVLFFSMSIAFAEGEASSTGDMLIENISIIDGKGNAPVAAQYGLEDLADAFRYQESQQHFGKICINVS